MTSPELIREIRKRTDKRNLGMTNAQIKYFLQGLVEELTAALEDEGNVYLGKDFGGFVCKLRAARTGRNPGTGEKISIPAQTRVVFRPSNRLKEALKR